MWSRKKTVPEPTYPSALMREWTDRLDREGSVEFIRSRRTLVRLTLMTSTLVAVGVLILVTASTTRDRALGVACLGMFGSALVASVRTWSQPSVLMTVDRVGVHIPRGTPIDIPWQDVVDLGTWKANRWGTVQLLIQVTPKLHAEWRGRLPAWQRTLFRTVQRSSRRDCIVAQYFGVPEDELAAWIDERADRLAPAVHDLVLVPEDHPSPLFSAVTLRPVALEKLGLSSELTSALREYADRAAQVAEEIDEGGAPGAAWGYLAGEGRQLCARVQRELGAGASVAWFEDGPRDTVNCAW